uniref:NADH-ubiquinone oxidoreductase chain 4 n=1 Tax=Lernaea cyprinacea TaxID=342429 RepID=A0A0U1XD56_9MAXI|nr:NADH dehydrogenase subunit 4 [Lernaea cyprinacea]AIQ80150.1 NADH dehydrogenase subunit 4 [Lernaea cyprinacea]
MTLIPFIFMPPLMKSLIMVISLLFFVIFISPTFINNNSFNNISLSEMSIYMIILTCLIIIMVNMTMVNKKMSNMIMILTIIMWLFFSENNLIKFFIWYEMALIPMFIMILESGYQPERMKAALNLFFYTALASSPLIISILIWSQEFNIMFMVNIKYFQISGPVFIFNLALLLSFLVKLPLYMFHLWLPKAHTEAPYFGSMFLAALMLKMGSYGLFQFIIFIQPNFMKLLFWICLASSLIISLIAMTETDLKVIIAYSSIAHMAMGLLPILGSFYLSKISFIISNVAHGFTSSAMFYIAYILYLKSPTRNLLMNKGFLTNTPVLMLFWFLTLMASAGSPPSINFIGELLTIMIAVNWIPYAVLILMLVLMTGTAYNMIIYTQTALMLPSYYMENSSVTQEQLTPIFLHPLCMFVLVLMMMIM